MQFPPLQTKIAVYNTPISQVFQVAKYFFKQAKLTSLGEVGFRQKKKPSHPPLNPFSSLVYLVVWIKLACGDCAHCASHTVSFSDQNGRKSTGQQRPTATTRNNAPPIYCVQNEQFNLVLSQRQGGGRSSSLPPPQKKDCELRSRSERSRNICCWPPGLLSKVSSFPCFAFLWISPFLSRPAAPPQSNRGATCDFHNQSCIFFLWSCTGTFPFRAFLSRLGRRKNLFG